ncbi:pseudouridine-5'-phosphate glycosidase, partial [Sulfitobacter sp. HI0021]
HKGAEDSFDISADLMELAQTPVTVIAAGAKAILDVPKTLEVLETQGVPVITVGQDSFPAFWSAGSDL